MYFSKAQNVRLKNADRQPVEGAVVVFSPLNVSEKGTVVISNNKGEAWVMGMPLPLIRKISMIGFLDRVDTVITSTTMEEIVLTTVPKTMGEVTITGNHIPGYQRDAVVPVQVLKSADIEKRGAVTVKDLLAQELNLRVSYDPSLGSSLSMQGTGGEHIKILVDGVPVIGRQNGNIDLGQINLSNIDRVEVVRGPMSVLYGTDALGGVINLITKTPLKQQLSATVTGFYETTGQYNTDVTVNYGNKNTAASLNLGRNFFDGWDPESNDSRSQLWNPREQYFGNVKLTRTIKTLKLTLQSAWFQEEVINKSEPFVTPYVAYANDQYYHTTRFNLQLVAEKKFKNNGVLNFTGAGSAYEYVKNTMRKDMVELSEQLTPDPLDDDTTNFNSFFSRATYVWADPKARWSVLGGVDANYEVGSGKRIDDATHNMTDVAGYMSIDYKPIERVTLRPSVRAIYNSRFDAPFVPSLNVLVKITDKITARSSFSKGYRAPSLKEQYLNFVDNGIHNVQGNPDLLAEKSNQWLASLEFRKGGQDYVLTVEPGFFYNDIRNKISLVQYDISSTLYTYVNLDRFNSRGMELKSRLAKKQFTVSAGISYTGTWGTFEGDVDQPEVAWYPEMNAAADYTFKKTKTTVSLFWKYYGDRPVFLMSGDGSIQRFDNESFQMMDASVRQQLVKERLSVTLGVRNLLDVTNVRAVSGGGAHSGGNGGEAPVAMGTCFFAKISMTIK